MNHMRVAVIGLGYVGLPLAIALCDNMTILGMDIDSERISELRNFHDRTGEITDGILKEKNIRLTNSPDELRNYDVYIVTVPTPVNSFNKPDLGPLESVSKMLGKVISRGSIICYESTVYPGITEDFCGKLLEEESELKMGEDFFLGYSPERINPGDRTHTVSSITKVVSAQNDRVLDILCEIYGSITKVHRSRSIRVAEMAKVIENTQRDINIALMNETALICQRLNISVYDVLESASTKWNFLPFRPGLVGGHCIGVDPYYLAECSQKLGHNPHVILAGRQVNDEMVERISDLITREIDRTLESRDISRVHILGATFKANVPDMRNSKVLRLKQLLQDAGCNVTISDPLVPSHDGVKFERPCGKYHVVILGVSHDHYKDIDIDAMLSEEGFLFDLNNFRPDVRHRRVTL